MSWSLPAWNLLYCFANIRGLLLCVGSIVWWTTVISYQKNYYNIYLHRSDQLRCFRKTCLKNIFNFLFHEWNSFIWLFNSKFANKHIYIQNFRIRKCYKFYIAQAVILCNYSTNMYCFASSDLLNILYQHLDWNMLKIVMFYLSNSMWLYDTFIIPIYINCGI